MIDEAKNENKQMRNEKEKQQKNKKEPKALASNRIEGKDIKKTQKGAPRDLSHLNDYKNLFGGEVSLVNLKDNSNNESFSFDKNCFYEEYAKSGIAKFKN
jgi:hypothetical protein